MARPKIHLTPEERTLAACRYRAKYYEKNRSTINKRITEKRRNTTQTSSVPKQVVALLGQPRHSVGNVLSRRSGRPKTQKDKPLKSEAATVDESQLRNALKLAIGKSLRERMTALCKGFISTGDYNEISDTLSAVEPIEANIRKLHAAGEYSQDTLYSTTRTIIRALENLLLNAMEGVDMSELERKGLLLYQAGSDVLLD